MDNAQSSGALERATIPLFPLHTVLFVGGRLPLRIFETRYIDMVRSCMRNASGFGVVLLADGPEARRSSDDPIPEVHADGTLAEITDFNQLEDGLLGILCEGRRRFRVRSTRVQADHLLLGEVEFLPEEAAAPVPEQHAPLVELLEQLMAHPMVEKLQLPVAMDDARSVGWRLADLLPVDPRAKQALLQYSDPLQRLDALAMLVAHLQGQADDADDTSQA